MAKQANSVQQFNLSSFGSASACERLDPAFHCQMLATWHRFGDGLYFPALVGWMGSETVGCKLTYVVFQGDTCLGFTTWQEARNFAAAAKRMDGFLLLPVEEEERVSTLHAKRQTPNATRLAVDAQGEVV